MNGEWRELPKGFRFLCGMRVLIPKGHVRVNSGQMWDTEGYNGLWEVGKVEYDLIYLTRPTGLITSARFRPADAYQWLLPTTAWERWLTGASV